MSSHKVKIKSLKPRTLALLQHVAMPAAGVSWLGTNLKPKHTPCSIRVTVAMDQSGVFKVKITHDGVTEIVNLNEGLPMTPSALYVFEFMVHKHDRINFACDTGASGFIQILRVEEIDSSAAQSSRQ